MIFVSSPHRRDLLRAVHLITQVYGSTTTRKADTLAHKYLNELGIKSDSYCIFNSDMLDEDRQAKFDEQRKTHGFDDRETWSMDYTLATWLYEHFCWYRDNAPIDTSWHTVEAPVITDTTKHDEFAIEKQTITQGQAIDNVIAYIAEYLKRTDADIDNVIGYQYLRTALQIVAEVIQHMWW